MNIKNIFKSKETKAREARIAAFEARQAIMTAEYWQIHRDVYARILRNRSRHTIEGAWQWAGRYADEYMTRRYGVMWTERPGTGEKDRNE